MKTDRNNWDRRYDQEEYFYGFEPNHFVEREIKDLPVGRGLFLAEGEGRNAVHAARLGHRVTALDNSRVGMDKALALAQRAGVELDYQLVDLLAEGWLDPEAYDFVVLCFAHLPPEHMAAVHARAVQCLRPGGQLIHCSFSRAQFGRKSGGPPRLEWLHEVAALKDQYAGVDFQRAEELEHELDEAAGHRGLAMIIEISGRKRP